MLLYVSTVVWMPWRVGLQPRTQAFPHSFFATVETHAFFHGCEKSCERPGYEASGAPSIVGGKV